MTVSELLTVLRTFDPPDRVVFMQWAEAGRGNISNGPENEIVGAIEADPMGTPHYVLYRMIM